MAAPFVILREVILYFPVIGYFLVCEMNHVLWPLLRRPITVHYYCDNKTRGEHCTIVTKFELVDQPNSISIRYRTQICWTPKLEFVNQTRICWAAKFEFANQIRVWWEAKFEFDEQPNSSLKTKFEFDEMTNSNLSVTIESNIVRVTTMYWLAFDIRKG